MCSDPASGGGGGGSKSSPKPKPKPKKIETNDVGYGVGQVDPRLAAAVNTKVEEPKLPDNSLGGPTKLPTGSKVYNIAGDNVEDTLTKTAPKLTIPDTKVDKPKANPKGGMPMSEQKLITKGNNVTHDAKIAAEERGPEPTKYNQDYWADQVAKGVPQADIIAEQNSLGNKKAYSGDQVVTKANSDTANFKLKKITGSDATLQNGGVTKTTETSGLAGENFTTTYDYTNGPKIVQKGTDPVVAGVRLGDKTSTTYVDGVEVATKTGHDPLGRDAVVTKPTIAGHITDTTKVQEPYTAPIEDKPSSVTAGAGSRGSTTSAAPTYGEEITPDKEKAISRRVKRRGKNALKIRRDKALNFTGSGTGLNIPR